MSVVQYIPTERDENQELVSQHNISSKIYYGKSRAAQKKPTSVTTDKNLTSMAHLQVHEAVALLTELNLLYKLEYLHNQELSLSQ